MGGSNNSMKPQQNLKCSICNKSYNNKKLLVRHLYKHEHPDFFSCSECGKTFPTKTRLNTHSRIHSEERAFKCPFCEMYFVFRFQLKQHQVRHTGEKPYSCCFCGKEFSSTSGLRQHLKTHTKESPFSCSQCGKSFKQKEKLRQHERIHTGVRPYMCDQCPKTFRIKNALVRHLRLHSGDTFKCQLCPKGFGELYALKKHHRKKHEKLDLAEKTAIEKIPIHRKSTVDKKTTTVKQTQINKNVSNRKKQSQKKRTTKECGLVLTHTPKESSQGDLQLNRDVIEKLYLAVGQRDDSEFLDENGWHRIPLPAAKDLLCRNTNTAKMSGSENSKKVFADVKNGIQQGKVYKQDHSPCGLNQRKSSPEQEQATRQQGEIVANTRSDTDVISSELLQMASGEVRRQKHENIHMSAINQQTSEVTRRRREITHPSTIEYFPAADQMPGPVYADEHDRLQFLNNSVQDPACTPYIQESLFGSLASDCQDSDFNRDSFDGNGALSGRFYSVPVYQDHHLQLPDHGQQPLQHQSFYSHSQPAKKSLFESDYRHHTATLHHRPEPYQNSYVQHQPQFFNTQQQYNCIVQEETTHQTSHNGSWRLDQLSDLESASYQNNSCHMQPQVPHHYQQVPCSSVPSYAPHASFTTSLQPSLSSATCGDAPTQMPHHPIFSLLPFQPSMPGKSIEQTLLQHRDSADLNQHQLPPKESLISNQPFQNEPALSNQRLTQQHLSGKRNQPFFDQFECVKSNQQEQFFSSLNFSDRLGGESALSGGHNALVPTSVVQETQSVQMFSHSKSGVIHHKPIPAVSQENQMDACPSDTWPVYFQMQHQDSNTHQNLISSFSSNDMDIPLKTSYTHSISNPGICSGNQHEITSRMNSFDLPKVPSYGALSNHIVAGSTYLNTTALQPFLQSPNGLPRKNSLQASEENVSNLIQSQLYDCQLNDCLEVQPTTAADCVIGAKDVDLSMIHTLPDILRPGLDQFACQSAQKQAVQFPDAGERQIAKDAPTNSVCGIEPPYKFKMNTVTSVLSETGDDDDLFNDNFNVYDDMEGDVVKIHQSLNDEVQPILDKHASEGEVDTMIKPVTADINQDREEDVKLSGKSKFESKVGRNRPRRSECFSKYRNSSIEVTNSCHRVSQIVSNKILNQDRNDVDCTSKSLSSSGLTQSEKSSNKSLDILKQSRLDSKIPKSRQRQPKQQQVKPISRKHENFAKEFNNNCSYAEMIRDVRISEEKSMEMKSERTGFKSVQDVTEKTINISSETDCNLVESDGKLMYNSKRHESSLSSSSKDIRKAEFIKRNSIINENKNITDCLSCSKKLKQTSHLQNNFKTNFGEVQHECPQCGKSFPKESGLQRHLKTHGTQKPYPCNICPQAFTTKLYLDNHLKRHDKQPPIFVCGDCGKTFSRRYQLKIHTRTHSGEKPYKCSSCSAHFATAFQVKLHELVHTDSRPYQCRFCSKCFRSKTNLALHVKRHTNNRPYLCATCGAAFYEVSKLKAHIRVHTGVHPFICDQCPKSFKVKYLLVRHLRWHNGDTFKCEHCDKQFDEKWILRTHMQKHHPGI